MFLKAHLSLVSSVLSDITPLKLLSFCMNLADLQTFVARFLVPLREPQLCSSNGDQLGQWWNWKLLHILVETNAAHRYCCQMHSSACVQPCFYPCTVETLFFIFLSSPCCLSPQILWLALNSLYCMQF